MKNEEKKGVMPEEVKVRELTEEELAEVNGGGVHEDLIAKLQGVGGQRELQGSHQISEFWKERPQ